MDWVEWPQRSHSTFCNRHISLYFLFFTSFLKYFCTVWLLEIYLSPEISDRSFFSYFFLSFFDVLGKKGS
jgi:hypothetical protein